MTIFTYKNLYKAYLDCRKTKRSTANALKFELNLEENLRALLSDLKSGVYSPGRSICFIVTEPCAREIFAADFRDRIVHHLFVRELMGQAEKMFIFDSYACRRNKGTHRAVRRAHNFSRRLNVIARKSGAMTRQSRGHQNRRWYMKVDIKSFFMSIDKDILYGLTLDLIARHKRPKKWEKEMAYLAKAIIFHNPVKNYIRKGNPRLAELIPEYKSLFGISADKGLPIGNYSSQFFANLYLNKLDHFIKRKLKNKYYIRYVDDLLLMSENSEDLKYYQDKINEFLKHKLSLELNKNKTMIQSLSRGFDWLGYFLKKNKIFSKREVRKRYKNKLHKTALGIRILPWPKTLAMAESYQGQAGYF